MEIAKSVLFILLCALCLIIRANCARLLKNSIKNDCNNEKDTISRSILCNNLKLTRLTFPKRRVFNTADLIREQYQQNQEIWENWKDVHPVELEPRMIISKQCSSDLCVCLSKNKKRITKCYPVVGQSSDKTHYIRNRENGDVLKVSVKRDKKCTCKSNIKLHKIRSYY